MAISRDLVILGTAILHRIDPAEDASERLRQSDFEPHLAQTRIATIDDQLAIAVPGSLPYRDAFTVFEYGLQKDAEPVCNRRRQRRRHGRNFCRSSGWRTRSPFRPHAGSRRSSSFTGRLRVSALDCFKDFAGWQSVSQAAREQLRFGFGLG